MNAHQAWQAVMGQLKMELSKAQFDTWIKGSKLLDFNEETGSLILSAANAYACDWLNDRMCSTVANKMTGLLARPINVRFSLGNADVTTKIEADGGSSSAISNDPLKMSTATHRSVDFVKMQTSDSESHLNSRYRFDNFVVGSSNLLAHAASAAVASAPGTAYNPLLIYSGSGLGKTHLLHAIGNEVVKSGLRVIYVTGEEFTNDIVDAIMRKSQAAFQNVREKYRDVDVLLVDDIQFLAGKDRTQEEFFHTFNSLHTMGKQIVMTSDCPPREMSTLEERLRSRFQWGLVVDMQAPDYETRMAILQCKAKEADRIVPTDVQDLLAREVTSNIRELEGGWNRVLAFSDLTGAPLTIDLAKQALADFLPERKEVTPEEVVSVVSRYYGISCAALTSKDRSKNVVLPRQVAMYLLREDSGLSLPQIGQELGGRDHTTVMYGCVKMSEQIENDEKLKRQVNQLREQLGFRRNK